MKIRVDVAELDPLIAWRILLFLRKVFGPHSLVVRRGL